MDHKTLIELIIIAVLAGIPALIILYIQVKKRNAYIPRIIRAERKRKAHPDIQTGRFNRLYTMPYNEDVNEYTVRAYLEERYPDYSYSISFEVLQVSDNMSCEERELVFTQLREEDITAIELRDPFEVVNEGNHKAANFVTRTTLHDLGFSKSLRTAILHFQEQTVAKRK